MMETWRHHSGGGGKAAAKWQQGDCVAGSGRDRQSVETEVKDSHVARKVLKADREKLRRDRLNEQFLELGKALDPDRPKNDKATILIDTVQILKDLTTQVGRLKAEYTSLSDESLELTEEKNELREEKEFLMPALLFFHQILPVTLELKHLRTRACPLLIHNQAVVDHKLYACKIQEVKLLIISKEMLRRLKISVMSQQNWNSRHLDPLFLLVQDQHTTRSHAPKGGNSHGHHERSGMVLKMRATQVGVHLLMVCMTALQKVLEMVL